MKLSVLILPIVVSCVPAATAADYWIVEHATALLGDPGSPRVVEDATIVLRDGIIVAVGRDMGLPDDSHLAERIDATGLVAHPAFIDALTHAGVSSRGEESRNADRGPDHRAGPATSMRAARRDGTMPERSPLDVWNLDSGKRSAYHREGFGSLVIAESRGFFPGRTSLVSLNGGPLRDCVIVDEVSQRVRFSRSRSGYPNSLMGAIAHLRQTFLDARHHAQWRSLRETTRRGVRRPPRDTALDALVPVVDGSLSAFVEASTENEVRRARRLADEFGLDLVVTGGSRAYRAVEVLRGGSGVILVPGGTARPRVRKKAGSLPLRVQQQRLARWSEDAEGAKILVEAGVPIAFGSGSGANAGKLLVEVRRAVEHGLDARQALRALTLGAAEILGVGDVLGSIEKGKIASIVLRARVEGATDGVDLGQSGAVRHVFVDGKRFDFSPPKKKDAKKTTPKETTPKETTPKETTPKETTPKETTPGSVGQRGEEEPSADPDALPTELDADRVPGLRTGGDVLIRGGTVLTMRGQNLESTDVRVRGGKIEAVGRGLEALESMKVIDARGWFVMPGIVDCHSHLATDGGVNESTQSITCEVRIADVLNPTHIGLYRALAGGVTTSNILHGSANTIGGQNAVIRNRYGALPRDLLFPGARPGVKFALGENPRRSNWGNSGSRFPQSRMGVEAVIRRAFADAKEYRRVLERHAARMARGEILVPPRRDLRLEALLEILDRKRVIHSHCYRADEIQMLLRATSDLGLELATLQHVLEGYKVAPEIAAAGVGASTFSDWWAYKLEAFDAIPHNSAILTRAGVVTSLNSDDAEMARRLNQEAAKQTRSGGLTHEEALRLITRNPARQLGILDRVGTIEIGKDADIAVFDAHPLSIYARCRYTLIEGEVWFERRDDDRRAARTVMPVLPLEDETPRQIERNPDRLYVLRGGWIVPVSGEPIERGTIVLHEGRIVAVGGAGDVVEPAGATVVDLEGLHVYPGLIDAGSQLGLTEIDSVRGSVDTAEMGEWHPDLRVATAINSHSELIPVARAGGVTSSLVVSTGPLIAGQAGVIRLAGTSTEEMVFRERAALHIVLPRVSREAEDDPPQVKVIEERFRRAREYFDRREQARSSGGDPPPVDLRLEAMEPYVSRELPVLFSADREPQIRLAIRVAERLDVKAVLRGGRDAWKVSRLLVEKKIPVIVGPVHALPAERHDPYDAPFANPGRLVAAGVEIAFQSNHASLSRNLPYQVGSAVAYGLPYDRALEALTLGAARILGIGEHVGSIEVGKLGDLLVSDGDPLEPATHVMYVFVNGEPVVLESRHTSLYERFRGRLRPREKRRKI